VSSDQVGEVRLDQRSLGWGGGGGQVASAEVSLDRVTGQVGLGQEGWGQEGSGMVGGDQVR
jgi:hypothetical protein